MNKIIMLILIIAGLSYFFKQHKTVVDHGPIVYAESNVKFKFPGREVDLVLIGQRYETATCNRDSVIEKISEICSKNTNCVETNYQCKTTIDNQYKAMFDKKPSRVYYTHLQHKTDNLKGIVLFWGLTDEESKALCKQLISEIDQNGGMPVMAQCIDIPPS